MHVSVAAGALLAPAVADGFAAAAWGLFDSCAFTHDRMFEASLAVSCFVAFILFFESIHLVVDPRVYRLDGAAPKRPLRGFTTQWWKTVVPALTYLGSIYVYHELSLGQLLYGPPPADVLAHGPGVPTWGRVVTELSLGVFLYDALFYPFHLSFHKLRARRWRKMHARHHVWGSTEAAAHNAVETVQNSYLDAGVQVFINIFVQHLSPWGFKHPLSRALHNVMVVYLLCESHSGYDLPFMSHRLFPGLFGGPVAHEQHHQQGNVNFHQFFLWADRILGHTPTAEQNRKHREALAAVGAAQDSARQQQAAAEVVR